jgi:hypothetical protein
MNFKEKLTTVLETLGFKQKFEDKTLSQEEFNQIVNSYKEKYKTTLQDDMASEQTAQAQANLQQQLNTIQAALDQSKKKCKGQNDDEEDDDKKGKDGDNGTCQENATMQSILASIQGIDTKITELAAKPAVDTPIATVAGKPISINGFGNTAEYLFGVEHELFSMKKRWNQIAANPGMYAAMTAPDEESEGRAFRQAARSYAHSLASRYAYLQQNHMLDIKLLESGEYSTNFANLDNAGLGDQFVIRRQDALIARVLKKRLLTDFFPVRYGIQDRDILFNAFFDEVSQAYQAGEVYKGGMKLENEMGYVDDAMVKLKFGPMKELERIYIGYLNREGSDPIKWSMIEYCLLNQLEQMQVEQNKRRMRGIYVKPEAGVAGSYLNAGTGVLYTLLRYVHDYSIKPHDDADHSYRAYTNATMLTAIKAFVSDVLSTLSEDEDLDGRVLYLNGSHKTWYLENVREKYGKDIDFSGPNSYANVLPDTDLRITWLPYLGQLPFMMIQQPGNIQFIENIPGEMMNVKMEEQMEMVRAWAVWKEGTGAAFTGRKFNSKEDMDKNAYEWQQIFTNIWAGSIAANATTADAAKGFWLITGKNTQATALTDITGAKEGVAYCIEIGDIDNATSISKSGKFANITKAFSPSKVGDYIMVILRKDGNFAELERREAGVRTINTELQPNVPGGRK